jgi:hypothetical protein
MADWVRSKMTKEVKTPPNGIVMAYFKDHPHPHEQKKIGFVHYI